MSSKNNDKLPVILIIHPVDNDEDWYKLCEDCKDKFRIEQASFEDISISSSEEHTIVNISPPQQIKYEFQQSEYDINPDLVLVRMNSQYASSRFKRIVDFRNILYGFIHGNIPMVNSYDSILFNLERPIMFGILKKIQQKIGNKNFPLIPQSYFSDSHKIVASSISPFIISNGLSITIVQNNQIFEDIKESVANYDHYCTTEPLIESEYEIQICFIAPDFICANKRISNKVDQTNIYENIELTPMYKMWVDEIRNYIPGMKFFSIQAVVDKQGKHFILDVNCSSQIFTPENNAECLQHLKQLIISHVDEIIEKKNNELAIKNRNINDEIDKYLTKMRNVQLNLINFFENDDDIEKLFCFLNEQNIFNDSDDFRMLLHFISSISANFHRYPNLFDKVKTILTKMADKIKQTFDNITICNIFKNSKKALLILIENKIITLDKRTAQKIKEIENLEDYHRDNYYFYPKIKQFLEISNDISSEIPENFEEKRRSNSNQNIILDLIQNDSIDEFIAYINQENYLLSSKVKPSIFETSAFLYKKNPTLIEYAAFYGSIKIFNYLRTNNIELTPSLWFYAIHGDNAEIINCLEENSIKPDLSYDYYYNEAIKCYHNDVANYIQENYIENKDSDQCFWTFLTCLEYHNFEFMKTEQINQDMLGYLCNFNFNNLVKLLINEDYCDINKIYKVYYFLFI